MTKPSFSRVFTIRWLACVGALAVSTLAADAEAGGFYFSDRGVRPVGRGGAFVAGADDLGAIWYNPAGIAESGSAVLFDATWLRFRNAYTRELEIVDSQGTVHRVESPKIEGTSPILPLPTFAVSYRFNRYLTVAGGVLAPYVPLASYPEKVDGQPSPARYTLGSFNGSRLGLPGIWVASEPADFISFGVGVLALVGTFRSTITFSASPQDRLVGAPEQPEYDAAAKLEVGPIFAPSANAGIIFKPDKFVRVGLSGQLPMKIDSDATLTTRLPTSAAFDSARVNGDQAHVEVALAAILRAGVEVRPVENLRVEVSYVRELWSSHDTIYATPKGISLDNVTGAPTSVAMPDIEIPRNYQDTNSYRLGGEYHFEVSGYQMDARAGVAHESSAVPDDYMSLSSLDFDKTLVAIGGGLYIGKNWRFDALYGHVFAKETYVDPSTAQIPRINPLKGNAPHEAVNGGTYTASSDLIGVGLNFKY
jgi:long-chain fatty acid transport protein